MRFSQLDGARIAVWGAGREIASLARQLESRLPGAAIVTAVFDGPPPADALRTLHAPQARLLDASEAARALPGSCDVLVRSPGVSIHREELRALREAGLPVTTPTALWLAEHGGGGVIGITGTKGKSTTAALAAHLARAAGRNARLAGNIGSPALDLLDGEGLPVVLELSSYQIADLDTGPEVAVLTNLFREHLDWHGSEESYRADKLRLFGLPGVRRAVVNAREEPPVAVPPGVGTMSFATREGWDFAEQGISLRCELRLSAGELPLRGTHNAANLCAALTALEAIGIESPQPAQALRDFEALPHRLQTVCERDGVVWVDDSISTTPESATAALASFPGEEIVLIGGGQDRGQDYAALGRALADARASVLGVPSTGARLVQAARAAGVPESRAVPVEDLAAAVALAAEMARPGTVVLLSPAAPSYDSFRDFEERGTRFRELAAALPQNV